MSHSIPGERSQVDNEKTPLEVRPAARADQSEAELGRANETGLNTDSRGGPGSATRAGASVTDPSPDGDGRFNARSTEPREGTRLQHHSSQGLAGAPGDRSTLGQPGESSADKQGGQSR